MGRRIWRRAASSRVMELPLPPIHVGIDTVATSPHSAGTIQLFHIDHTPAAIQSACARLLDSPARPRAHACKTKVHGRRETQVGRRAAMLRRTLPYACAAALGIATGVYIFNEPLAEAAKLARARADEETRRRRAEDGGGSGEGNAGDANADEPEWRRARRDRQRQAAAPDDDDGARRR